MKITVTVDLDPNEVDQAQVIENQLATALRGVPSDVRVSSRNSRGGTPLDAAFGAVSSVSTARLPAETVDKKPPPQAVLDVLALDDMAQWGDALARALADAPDGKAAHSINIGVAQVLLADADAHCGTLTRFPLDDAPRAALLDAVASLDERRRAAAVNALVTVYAQLLTEPANLPHPAVRVTVAGSVLCGCVRRELVPLAAAVKSGVTLASNSATEEAGTVILAKLVERFAQRVREANDILGSVRNATTAVQQRLSHPAHNAKAPSPDALYSVAYISETLGVGNFASTDFLRRQAQPVIGSTAKAVIAMTYSAARDMIIAATSDANMMTYFNASPPSTLENPLGAGRVATALDVGPRGKLVVLGVVSRTGNKAPSIVVHGDAGGHWSERLVAERAPNTVITCVRFLRSMAQYCTAECGPASSAVKHYDASRSTPLVELAFHSDIVTSLYAPNAQHTMVSGSRDRTVALFDVRTPGTPMSSVCHHTGGVTCLGGEAEFLVSGGSDGMLIVYDVRKMHTPLNRRTLDSAILSTTVGSRGVCAVSTQGAVYLAGLQATSSMSTAKLEDSVGRPAAWSLAWNASQSQLYAAGASGDVEVYRSAMLGQ